MGEVVNLRLARKRATRAAKDESAVVNRAKNGLSKAERCKGDALRELDARRHDAHRRETPGDA